MNPLNKILVWFDSQEDLEIKKEFIILCSLFHFNQEIRKENREQQIKLFRGYMDSDTISPQEIISRALFLISLFNLALVGRDTEEGWEKSKKLHQEMQADFEKEGDRPKISDSFVKTFDYRKTEWVKWSQDWYNLVSSDFEKQKLTNWYFSKKGIL